MCTLTYIPSSKGFTFTHNRDELSSRPTSDTIIVENEIYFPKDLRAGGTWFATVPGKGVACILNGGLKPYKRKVQYRQSRGMIPLHYFDFENSQAFLGNYDFNEIEPFTLITASQNELIAIIHDEEATYQQVLPHNQPHIWASTTLYTEEVRNKRKRWFTEWLSKNPCPSPSEILNFHRNAGDGDSENDMIMSRWGLLSTSSITQAQFGENSLQMDFFNLISDKSDHLTL